MKGNNAAGLYEWRPVVDVLFDVVVVVACIDEEKIDALSPRLDRVKAVFGDRVGY